MSAMLVPVSACFSDEVVDIEGMDMQAALTPSVLAQLTQHGQLKARKLTLPQAGISEDRAVQLAVAVLSQFGSHFRATIERQAGRAVSLEELRPEEEVLFAETPYEPLAAARENFLKAWSGPAYIVTFSDQAGPAVAVSVSAYAGGITIEDGLIVYPPGRNGNEFRLVGLDRAGRYGPSHSAEGAAKKAYAAFGMRVAAAPRFVRWGVDYMPFVGAWQLSLETPVQLAVEGNGIRSTDVVFLEPDGSFTTAVAAGEKVVRDLGDMEIVLSPRADVGQARARAEAAYTGGGR